MPRFVLLRHECPPALGTPSHWDLMLEREDALMTWSLSELPEDWQTAAASEGPIAATRIADHRLDYLAYEGPVSGGRGAVSRVDEGEYLLIDESALELLVALHGAMVNWRGALPRTADQSLSD